MQRSWGRENKRVPGAAGMGESGEEQPWEWRSVRGRVLRAVTVIRW